MKKTPMPSATAPAAVSTLIAVVALALLTVAAAGCSFKSSGEESSEFFKKIFRKETYSLYRIDIQQGNEIDPARLARLKPGMSKEQVRYLLGNPVADNVFHKNRWHYTYYLIPGEGETQKYRLTLFFDEDRLSDIRKSKTLAGLTEQPKKKPRRKDRGGG